MVQDLPLISFTMSSLACKKPDNDNIINNLLRNDRYAFNTLMFSFHFISDLCEYFVKLKMQFIYIPITMSNSGITLYVVKVPVSFSSASCISVIVSRIVSKGSVFATRPQQIAYETISYFQKLELT